MKAALVGCLAVACTVAVAGPAAAQDTKSAALVSQLAAALDAAKLDSIAAKDPSSPDTFVGILYFPGLQILAVSAKYTAPVLLDARLAKREYRDVYIDLNAAAAPGTKVFVTDLGSNGLRPDAARDQPSDGYEGDGKRVSFDGDWGAQQLSEADYQKLFATAEERYVRMLMAVLAELNKT
jgi:hypothetical protein